MDGYKTLHGRYALILGPHHLNCLRIMLRAASLGEDAGRYMSGDDRDPMEQLIVTVGSLLGAPIFDGEDIIDVASPEQPVEPMDWSAVRLACLTWATERLRCLFPDGNPSAGGSLPSDVVVSLELLFEALDGDMPLAMLSEPACQEDQP